MRSATSKLGLALGCALAACLSVQGGLPYENDLTPGGYMYPVPAGTHDLPGSRSLVADSAAEGWVIERPDTTGLMWQAKVESRVYLNYPGNVNGGYSFEYKLSNTSSGAMPSGADISLLSLGLGGSAEHVGIGLTPPGTTPLIVAMGKSGLSVMWLWGGGLSMGEEGAVLIVHSPFKIYVPGTAAVTGSGGFQSFPVFVPVPEPSTYAGIFALGLAGFAFYRRLRNR